MKTLYEGEVTYVNSTYSTSGGACVRLRLPDLSDLQTFEGHEGKRYMVALVEIGNDEQPTATAPYKKERLGPLCEWAVMRCKEPLFWEFLNEDDVFSGNDFVDSEQKAKETVTFLSGVNSRKELDSNPQAANWFKKNVIGRWEQWLKNRERVQEYA